MILHNFQLRKSNVRRFLDQPFWCCYYHSTLLVPSFSAKKWVDRQFYCLWTKRRDGGKTGSERLFPPQIGLGPWISPRVLLRQTESNNLEKQRRSNQSHEKKNINKNPVSTSFQIGTNTLTSEGADSATRTALRSFPHWLWLWLSLSLSSHPHVSLLAPEPSFQVHPKSKDLCVLWPFSAPDHSFPRQLLSM